MDETKPMLKPQRLFSGSVNGLSVEATMFLYRNPLEPKNVFRWGVRIDYFQPAARFELFPSPYEASSESEAIDRGEMFLALRLGLNPTDTFR